MTGASNLSPIHVLHGWPILTVILNGTGALNGAPDASVPVNAAPGATDVACRRTHCGRTSSMFIVSV